MKIYCTIVSVVKYREIFQEYNNSFNITTDLCFIKKLSLQRVAGLLQGIVTHYETGLVGDFNSLMVILEWSY